MQEFKYIKNKLHSSLFILDEPTLKSGEQKTFTLDMPRICACSQPLTFNYASQLLRDFCKLDIGNIVGYMPVLNSGSKKYKFETDLALQDGKIILNRNFEILCKRNLPYAYFEDTNDYLIFSDKTTKEELSQKYSTEKKCEYCGRAFGRTKKKVIDSNNKIMHVNCYQESSNLSIEDVKLICYAILQNQKVLEEYQCLHNLLENIKNYRPTFLQNLSGVVVLTKFTNSDEKWEKFSKHLSTMLLISHLGLNEKQIVACYVNNQIPTKILNHHQSLIRQEKICFKRRDIAKAINVMQNIESVLSDTNRKQSLKQAIINKFIANTKDDPDLENYDSYRTFAENLLQGVSISKANDSSNKSAKLIATLTTFLCNSENSSSYLDYLGGCFADAFKGCCISKIKLELLFKLKRSIVRNGTHPEREWNNVMRLVEDIKLQIIDNSGKVVTKQSDTYFNLKENL